MGNPDLERLEDFLFAAAGGTDQEDPPELFFIAPVPLGQGRNNGIRSFTEGILFTARQLSFRTLPRSAFADPGVVRQRGFHLCRGEGSGSAAREIQEILDRSKRPLIGNPVDPSRDIKAWSQR